MRAVIAAAPSAAVLSAAEAHHQHPSARPGDPSSPPNRER